MRRYLHEIFFAISALASFSGFLISCLHYDMPSACFFAALTMVCMILWTILPPMIIQRPLLRALKMPETPGAQPKVAGKGVKRAGARKEARREAKVVRRDELELIEEELR